MSVDALPNNRYSPSAVRHAMSPEEMRGKGREGEREKRRVGRERGEKRGEKEKRRSGEERGRKEVRQDKARQGKARQGKARQGKARQGKARQGKAEHTCVEPS
jgi:hypothetical protein